MQEIRLKVRIETLSPLNIGSGTQSKNEKLSYTVRRKIEGQSVSFIPGTTIKGKLRYYFELLNNGVHNHSANCQCTTCQLFGRAGYMPAKLYVEDFKLVQEEATEIRSANCIDRRRRVCVEGALFTKETVYGTYEGEIVAYVEDISIKEDLIAATKMIKDIGSGKSRGLGQVKVTVEEV